VMKVHNDGPPIPEALVHRVFDALVQADKTQKKQEQKSSSLGLGLYICRTVTEAHGGTISVESSRHEGTTFIVSLPRDGGRSNTKD
jgi:signal transduction histidine kinase